MNNLKPKFCGWLHQDRSESNEIMLIKGWEKIGLTRVWDDDFQFVALGTNTTTPLL
jgi:hypothetical protein